MRARDIISYAIALFILCTCCPAPTAHAQQLTWTQLNGPLGGTVTSLAADSSGTIYAGMSYGTLFRSTDGGMSWSRTARPAIPLMDVASLAVTRTGMLFAATYNGSTFRSSDGGDSWIQVRSTWQYNGTPTLATDGEAQILLGSDWGALYRSTDLGATWTTVDSIADVSTITYGAGRDIYIGGSTGWFNGTLYRSTDDGASWRMLHRRTQSEAVTGIVRRHGLIIVGTGKSGVIRSTDDGVTWSPANDGLTSTTVLRLIEIDATTMMAITETELFITRNLGEQWSPIEWSLPLPLPTRLLPIGNDIVLGATPGGGIVRISLSSGVTTMTNANLIAQEVTSIATFPGGKIVAGTLNGGIHTSSDNGLTWRLGSRVYEHRQAGHVTRLPSGTLLASSAIYLLRSTNDGNSWEQLDFPIDVFQGIVVAPSGEIITSLRNNGFYSSSDDGQTWARMFMEGSFPDAPVTAMAFSGDTLVVGTYGSSILSGPHRGDTLTLTKRFAPRFVQTMTAAPNGLVYIAEREGGMFYSFDNGRYWIPFITPPDSTIATLIVTPSGDIIAGTERGGIWRLSADGGAWMLENTGVPEVPVRAFAFDSSGAILVGTLGSGIFRSSLPVSVREEQGTLSSPLQLLSASPNPSRGELAVRFTVDRFGPVRITVTDLLGNVVTKPLNGELDQGEHVRTIDLSSLPSGSYRCTIAAGGSISTTSITVTR